MTQDYNCNEFLTMFLCHQEGNKNYYMQVTQYFSCINHSRMHILTWSLVFHSSSSHDRSQLQFPKQPVINIRKEIQNNIKTPFDVV